MPAGKYLIFNLVFPTSDFGVGISFRLRLFLIIAYTCTILDTVVYSLRTIRSTILLMFRSSEYRSKKANSYSVKVEFFIYGILYTP